MQQESKQCRKTPSTTTSIEGQSFRCKEVVEKVKEIGFNPFDDEVCQGSTCFVVNEQISVGKEGRCL